MRKSIILLPLLFACSKAEAPANSAADTTAAVAPAPAPLTEADVAGTWKGTAMLAGTDSVIARFTQVCATGTCKGTMEGSTVTVTSSYMLMADSAMGTSQPYVDPAAGKDQVVDMYSLHIQGGKVTGNGALHLASKPDSVVMRYRFEGSRVP